MKNELNKFIEKYKDFNNKIIEAKKHGIKMNENNKNELMESNELLNNEIKKFCDSQNINDIIEIFDIKIIKNINDIFEIFDIKIK